MTTLLIPPTVGRVVVVRRLDGAPLIIGGTKTVLEPDGGLRLTVPATSGSIAHVFGDGSGDNADIAVFIGPKLIIAEHEDWERSAESVKPAPEYLWSWPPRVG